MTEDGVPFDGRPADRAPATASREVAAATLAGSGALVLWAGLAMLSRLAAALPPLQITAIAFATGGLLALAAVAARGRLGALRQRPGFWLHGVTGLFGYHALYFGALALAPAVEANLLNYLWPLLIVLLSGPLLGLPLRRQHLFGVALGAAGCALLVGPGAAFPAGALPGLALAAGAALCWALYSVTSRRFADVPTEAVAGPCLVTALLAGIGHLMFETTVAPGPLEWLALTLMGLGPLGAAFFLWDTGMKRGDPRLLGTLAYAVPVASTLLLIMIGEGALTWRVTAAAALVAGGGWMAARG